MSTVKYFKNLEKLNKAIIFLANIDSDTCDINELEKKETLKESSSIKNIE